MAEIKLPYNFIELNEKVMDAYDLPDRRYFNLDRKSGVINCTLKTLSPLYIAASKGVFFHHGDLEKPVIPGSSLRGMIRNIVQIITWSKIQPVTKKEMYLRDIDNEDDYMQFMRDKVFAGFIRKDDSGYFLETCDYYKLNHALLLNDIPDLNNKKIKAAKNWMEKNKNRKRDIENINKWINDHVQLPQALQEKIDSETLKAYYFERRSYPKWDFQNKPVWIKSSDNKVSGFKIIKPEDTETWKQGVLVLTGWMDNKKHEYVFIQKEDPQKIYDERVTQCIEDLEDVDQISDWQKTAFPVGEPKDQPELNKRRKPGAIRIGEPVFYILDNDDETIKFFGRAQMFRLHYGRSPYHLLPENHRSTTQIDMAEAIFGFVEKDKEGEPQRSYAVKGRVSFSDGIHQPDDQNIWLKDNAFAPRILASPKPASYTTYLEQPENLVQHDTKKENVGDLIKYSSANAKLRGHKLYWHQVKQVEADRSIQPLGYDEIKQPDGNRNFEQLVKPIKPDQGFFFKIHFEDLTETELGALLWALTLPGTEYISCAHKLGMGKSIGMGSVEIKIDSLQMLNLSDRYHSLDSQSSTEGNVEEYVTKFKESMDQFLGSSFSANARIKQLRMILSRPGMNWEDIKYEDSQGFRAYSDKPILSRVEIVYAQASLSDKTQKDEDALIGKIIHGTVVDRSSEGITFVITDLLEINGQYAFVPKEYSAGKTYQIGHAITAKIIRIDRDDDGDIYICTLDF